MRLNLALLGIPQKQGVGGVGDVGSSVDAGETAHACSSPGVGGVGKPFGSGAFPHLPTPEKGKAWDETAAPFAVPTPPTLPTKQSSGSGLPESPDDLPEPVWDISGYAEDFGRWLLAHCVFLDRCWCGVAALHRAWCDWCFLEHAVPANLPTFRALLEDEGFALTERGMVYGLLLRVDWEAAWAPTPADADAPAARESGYRGDLLLRSRRT